MKFLVDSLPYYEDYCPYARIVYIGKYAELKMNTLICFQSFLSR